jgi:HEPN domain-containing protein
MSSDLSEQWLEKAAEDLDVARLVVGEGHVAHACFLAQQCIEKSLKGFLMGHLNEYPRVHKLVDLLAKCQSVDPGFELFVSDCIVVDQYYIPTRYPDGIPGSKADGIATRIEAQEAMTAAGNILAFVQKRLRI